MDLKLLIHLSEEALRTEARRRGIAVAGKSREAIIDAIREDAEPRPANRSVLGTARALLGRVVRKVRWMGAAPGDPASRVIPVLVRDDPIATKTPGPVVAREPIATRTMAELLIDQGHLERAIGILRGLGDDSAKDRLREVESRLTRERLQKVAAAHSDHGVAIFAERDARAVGWNIDEPGIRRARALLGTDGELTLRIVTVEADPAHAVSSRRVDRGPIERRGAALLDAGPAARLVISVGLCSGDRFVSIAHAAG